MTEYYYYSSDGSTYGIGLPLLDSLLRRYTKRYTRHSSSTPVTYSYVSSYYGASPIGIRNVNTYIKSFRRPIPVSYDNYYYGSGDSYGIGLSLLNF